MIPPNPSDRHADDSDQEHPVGPSATASGQGQDPSLPLNFVVVTDPRSDSVDDDGSSTVPPFEADDDAPFLRERTSLGGVPPTNNASSSLVTATECPKRQGNPLLRGVATLLKGLGAVTALWIAQVALVVLLRRCGWVSPDFRPLGVASPPSSLSSDLAATLELPWMLLESGGAAVPSWNVSLLASAYAGWNALAALATAPANELQHKRPGHVLAHQYNAQAHFPVVMVPGFVTSGLEVWSGTECATAYFRRRLWAAADGARAFLLERDCWREHMMLDPVTGSDPEHIKVRASSGFEAADYFIANYWVWGKLLENLADVGYTPSTMAMMPYDWRLAFPILEERDGYLTRLKSQIEDLHRTTGRKVVLTSHSMGALLVHYFFAWVTTPERHGGGGGGQRWVDQHVHAYVNLAGSHLGVPKAATALLSGEMSDTLFLGTMGSMVEQFFGRKLRRDLWSSWGSLWSMLPKGGDRLWGSGADMCDVRTLDDPFCLPDHPSPLLVVKTQSDDDSLEGASDSKDDGNNHVAGASNSSVCLANRTEDVFVSKPSHTAEEAIQHLQEFGAGYSSNHSASRLYSFRSSDRERPSFRTWHDPTRTPLPHAPNMRLYCFYGTGIDTERAYYYQRNVVDDAVNNTSNTNITPSGFSPLSDPSMIIDPSVDDATRNVRRGIRYVDGDGSVPLLSLGYLCADLWRRPSSGLNPSNLPITTREYPHQTEFTVDDPMRSGPRSSDHVDLLGNTDVMRDFLKIVTNLEAVEAYEDLLSSSSSTSEEEKEDSVKSDRFVSNIREIAEQIHAEQVRGPIARHRRMSWDALF